MLYSKIFTTAMDLLIDNLSLHFNGVGSKDSTILIIGASTSDLLARVMALCASREDNASIHLIEEDQTAIVCAINNVLALHREKIKVSQMSPVDLKIDPQVIEQNLQTIGCGDLSAMRALHSAIEQQSRSAPLIADASIDTVIVDLITNRMTAGDAKRTISEAFRVLKKNGRLLMTVLMADEIIRVPLPMTVGGWKASQFPIETEIFMELERAGYHGMRYINYEMPETIEHANVELGLVVIEAHKGKQGECLDQGHAVIFRGPWREVYDDDGHRYGRGERTAVCAKTYAILMQAPYADFFFGLPCRAAPPLKDSPAFDCATPAIRHPRITKGIEKLDSSTCC